MKNPLKKAYESFDNFMMHNANNAVHAWNWTTGRTKADLANLVLDATAVTFNFGILLSGLYFLPISALLSIPIIHYEQKENIIIDEKEQKAAEDNLKEIEVEFYKNSKKNSGTFRLAFSTAYIPFYMAIKPEDISGKLSSIVVGTSFILWGSADYIMRADYLPPRKNCLSRAKDKITEIIEAYKSRPELATLPAS